MAPKTPGLATIVLIASCFALQFNTPNVANAGLPNGSIHGIVWSDDNGSSQPEPGEPDLPGVTVYLDLNFNPEFDHEEPSAISMSNDPRTQIDETGLYWLENVPPNRYLIREVVPDGFVQTFPRSAAGPPAHDVSIRSGETIDGIDFGNQPPAPSSIHGFKWLDENANATRDPNEPGLAGVTIYTDVNLNGQLDAGEPRAITM
jgi:hypothetical protein